MFDLIPSEVWIALGAAVAAVVAWLTGRRSGRSDERADRAADELKSAERGTQGAEKARGDLRDGKTPEEIIRGNDGMWK